MTTILAADTIYEQVMNALFTRIKTICAGQFLFYSRRLIPWDQMVMNQNTGTSPIRLPALFLYDGMGFGGGFIREEPRGRGTPGVRIMFRTVVVYDKLPGGSTPSGPDVLTPGGTGYHALYASIEQAFEPDSEGALTLGRLVSHCWIQGDVMMTTGDIDPDGLGLMAVPVQIMLP